MVDDRLPSERVVVAAPMSFVGSAKRLWRPVAGKPAKAAVPLGVALAVVILVVWCLVLVWYVIFGICLVPYRLIRRGSRNCMPSALITSASAPRARWRMRYGESGRRTWGSSSRIRNCTGSR